MAHDMAVITLVLRGGERIGFDRILAATGRRPATDDLGLDSIGASRDARGAVEVDGRLATSARNVYAAGDAIGAPAFTHVAGYHGRTVVANALFRARTRVDHAAVPWATFTDPEVAQVGLSEAKARERHGDRRGRLLGATVAGPHAGESIAELAAWMRIGGKIDDVSHTVHPYPTFTEGQARAADEHLIARFLNPRVRRLTRPALALLRLVDRPR